MNALSWFASFFQGGGPFMYAILGVGVLILGTALERFFVIARASSWNTSKLVRDLSDRIQKGDTRGALGIAEKVKSPAGQLAAALIRTTPNEETLNNVADGETALAVPRLTRRLSSLSLFANVATLLGLLGTIFGLTTAFAAVGAADPSQRSAFLAAGISQALNTTAFGLIVAVPTMLVHGFLVQRVERIVEHLDEVAVRITRSIMDRGVTPTPAASQGHAAQPAPAGAAARRAPQKVATP